jgi:Mn-dependent DtxR family transcriptional regulator
MSKQSLLNYFKYYPTKTKGFTIKEIAKFNKVSTYSVYITIRKLRQRGIVIISKASKGRGRGRGKTLTIYTFSRQGINWLKYHNIMV